MNEIQIIDLSTIINEMGTTGAAQYLDKTYSNIYEKKLKEAIDESYKRGKNSRVIGDTWWNRIGNSIYCLAAAVALCGVLTFVYLRFSTGAKMLDEELAACRAGDASLCMRLLSRTSIQDTDRNLAYNIYYEATGKKLPGVFYDPKSGDIVFADIEEK